MSVEVCSFTSLEKSWQKIENVSCHDSIHVLGWEGRIKSWAGKEEQSLGIFSSFNFSFRKERRGNSLRGEGGEGGGGGGESTYKRGQEEANDEEEDVSATEVCHCG